jgi:hypothetical protein
MDWIDNWDSETVFVGTIYTFLDYWVDIIGSLKFIDPLSAFVVAGL